MGPSTANPFFPPLAVTALATGLVWGAMRARQQRITLQDALPGLVIVIAMMVAGAKVYSMIERGERAWWLPGAWSVGELTLGFRHPGAMFGCIVGGVIARLAHRRGRSVAELADIAAPPMCLLMAIMRVNCVVAGCCDGRLCQSTWCHAFANDRHPLALYLLAWLLVVGLFLLWVERRQVFTGQIALTYLALHETGKAAIESYRFPPNPFVQHGSAILACGATVVLATMLLRGKLPQRPRGALHLVPTCGADGDPNRRGPRRRIDGRLSIISTPPA